MAKRLKNLRRKQFRNHGNPVKCYSCLHYFYELDDYCGPEVYNECLVNDGLNCYNIRKHKFCKKYNSYVKSITDKKKSYNDNLPF